MSKQVSLTAEPRTELGKGPTGRLRRTGRVPAIVYGYEVEPTAVHVDALELYHVLHTEAGRNVMIRLDIAGDTTLVFARDLQIHPIRQEVVHVDFLAVDRNAQISVEVPVHLLGEDDTADDNGVLNQILYTVPIAVKPLDVPNYLELDVTGLAIGDVKRVEDLTLPDGADFEIEPERTVVTINAPISEDALEALEAEAGIEQEAPTAGDEEGEAAAASADEDAAGDEA
ncbi:50S ribosomal protein L25 [Nitriliruptor alkaliphilus]|uniref:50S ribosomal protein L25 n=1 Tax=Nitriliruptor alkaliphilus TaxID=427918 RepID=UPI0006985012|nr:50S ribosomal protein L25 [Nitriliruptor alkaliphilus]